MAGQELPSAIGRYEVVSRLGQGGMGSLYLAKDPKIGRLVAIKLVRQEFDSPEARQRFAREAQSAGTLRHPNIVTIFDVDEHDGLPFIAMEYIDGETLAEIVKRKALLPPARRIQWVEDLCSGLAYAHRQGVIHRDIKPANLMVDNEGALKILDFGLARRDASKFTQSHVIIGTPNYMSPEQIRGQNIDTRSDIFSVGALLYELLTYREAFPGAVHQTMHKILHEEPEPIEQLVPDLDPALPKILGRALVKDRDGRYADLSAMKADLNEARVRMEAAAASSDSATIPMSRTARFDGPARNTMPLSRGSAKTGSSGSSKKYQTNRQDFRRRRAENIGTHLDESRRLLEQSNLDKAKSRCEEALLLDPDHPGALQLMDDILTEIDRQQMAAWIAEARAELQKGQLDRAEALVAQARGMAPDSPDVQQLQDAIDTTRREIERTRQIQETMRRARARFSEQSFDAAIRAASEVLAIDPENVAAKDLQKRAQEAIEAQANRADRDKAAQAAVAAARKLFESGDKDGAIAQLQAFSPKHDLVTAFLATLKGEKVHAPEPVAAAAAIGGETAHILRGARGEAPSLPARRYFLIAAAVFSVVVVGATLYFRPWERAPETVVATEPPPAATPSAEKETPPAPTVVPEPAPVRPAEKTPEKLAEAPNQNDAEVLKAIDLLNGGKLPEARRLAQQIAKRDPKYANTNVSYKLLLSGINQREEFEKKQAEAAAAAAAAAKPAAPPAETAKPTQPLSDPVNPPNANPPAAFTVAPFGATSEPPSPEMIGKVARPEIEKAISEYAAALATLDVRKISQVRSLNEKQAESWQRIFRNLKGFRMNVKLLGDPIVKDDIAEVQVQELWLQTNRGGIEIENQRPRETYRLRKSGGQWKLLPPQ